MNTRQYEKSNHYLEEALRICKQLSNPHVPPPLRQMVIEPAAAVIEPVVIEPVVIELVEMSKCRTVIELAAVTELCDALSLRSLSEVEMSKCRSVGEPAVTELCDALSLSKCRSVESVEMSKYRSLYAGILSLILKIFQCKYPKI